MCCTCWGAQQSSGHHRHSRIVCAVHAQVFAEWLNKSSVFIFTVSSASTLLSQGGSRFSKETGSDEPLTSVLSGTGGG